MPDLRKGYLYIAAADIGVRIYDLRYRLEREGTTYRALLLAERQRRLVAMLAANPEPYLIDVAHELGYVSTKAARIALRVWGGECGVSPTTHRKRVQQQNPAPSG